jgi:hypothetical protein
MSELDKLYLSPTEETPEVLFDKEKPEFRITGKSYMEDAMAHYHMVIAWLLLYKAMPNSITNFIFELEYVNTASSKVLHEILDVLDTMYLEGANVVVEWRFYDEDEDMEEMGQELEELYEVPFVFKEISFPGARQMFDD